METITLGASLLPWQCKFAC